jgi:hypothetical protein
MAYRKPVSTAQPTPFSGSLIRSTGTGAVAAKPRTTPAVPSVEPLSTTSRVKSRSVCAARLARVASIFATSLYAGTTTQSAVMTSPRPWSSR